MANVKTAISLQKTLFEQVEALAREMKVSRSRVFVLALENFIREYQDKQLFDKINRAYEDAPPDKTERLRLRQIRRQHRRIIDKTQLGEHIGALSKKRVRQILDGLRLITEPRESPR